MTAPPRGGAVLGDRPPGASAWAGCPAGRRVGRVVGIYIDENAIRFAQSRYSRPNFEFRLGDARARDPVRYGVDYMIPATGPRHAAVNLVATFAYWLMPGYIWVLEKPRA